jgi:hypothetical protein
VAATLAGRHRRFVRGAFVLVVGTLAYGLFLPTDIDPNSKKAPAPPAVAYLSPVIALAWIAGDGFAFGSYGVRYPDSTYNGGGGGPGTICQTSPGGGTSCYSTGSGPVPLVGKGGGFVQVAQAPTGTIPSGLFEGWQYWQATVVMQLAICLIALVASALLLAPIRRLPWRRQRTGAELVAEATS